MPGDAAHPLVLFSGDDKYRGRKTTFRPLYPTIPDQNMYYFRWYKNINMNGTTRELRLYSMNPSVSADTFRNANRVNGQLDFNGHVIINAEGSMTAADGNITGQYKFKPADNSGTITYVTAANFLTYLTLGTVLRNGLDIAHLDFFTCNLGRGTFCSDLRDAINAYNLINEAAPINVAANGIRASNFYVNRNPSSPISFSSDTAEQNACLTLMNKSDPFDLNAYNGKLATVQNVVIPGLVLFATA
jgi:hypothetical protein